jgi:hypothetical protein
VTPIWQRVSWRYLSTGLVLVALSVLGGWMSLSALLETAHHSNEIRTARFVLMLIAAVSLLWIGLRDSFLGAGLMAFVAVERGPDGPVLIVRGHRRFVLQPGRTRVEIITGAPTRVSAPGRSSQWTVASGKDSLVLTFFDTPSQAEQAAVQRALATVDPRISTHVEAF